MDELEIIRSRRKTISLELRRDGRAVLRAPLWASDRELRRFLERSEPWLAARRRELAARPAPEPMSDRELAALKKRGRAVFPARAAYFAPLVGVGFGRVSVRSQRSKWGSCSARGDLSFNCLLLLAPEAVLDYVVVHELCHRLEMNHSARFWQQVERVLPDYAQARRWLRDNGGTLLDRLPEKTDKAKK